HFAYEDDRLDTIADHLLEQQMPDGGWNCRRRFGATHSSVNTTISALEGLRYYELHRGRKVRAVRAAQRRGREYLLVHRLWRAQPLEHPPRAAGAEVVGSGCGTLNHESTKDENTKKRRGEHGASI